MRNAVATIAVALLCLALAPCVVQASRKQQPNTVDDTKQAGTVVVLAGSSGASWDLDAAAFEILGQTVGHRRSLKKAKSKASKSKKYKGTKWAKGKATLWGSVIGVAIFVAVVGVCTVFLLVTEKKEQHPKWHLFKRRVKPGVRRTVTRTFTRKKPVDDMETKKMPDDPPKLQGEA